jgi:hypothetical protein
MGLKESQKARMKILTKKRKATTNKVDKVNKTTLVKKKHFQTKQTLVKSVSGKNTEPPVGSGPSGQLKIVVKKKIFFLLPVRRSLSSIFEDSSIKRATTVKQKGRNVGAVDSIPGDSSSDNDKEIVPLKKPKLPDGQALKNTLQFRIKTRGGKEKASKLNNFLDSSMTRDQTFLYCQSNIR